MKLTQLGILMIVAAISFSQKSTAKDLDDPSSVDALAQTQAMLTDPEAIKAEGGKNAAAKQADSNAGFVVGQENKAEVYQLASELFATIANESGGDPEKMKALLAEAQRSPAAFINKFSPEQKAKLSGIANKVESHGPAVHGR
jgi:hypothetical protein